MRANFLSMMHRPDKGIPVAFGVPHNARSLVAPDNLVDLVRTCIQHPAAPKQTFLVSDGEDLSTPDLLRRTATAMGKTARWVPVPEFLLRSAATIVGQQSVSEAVCGSLRVDIVQTRRLLGWSPQVSVDQALKKTARYFLDQHGQQ